MTYICQSQRIPGAYSLVTRKVIAAKKAIARALVFFLALASAFLPVWSDLIVCATATAPGNTSFCLRI